MTDPTDYALGSIETAEALLADLYVALRRKTILWAELTKQTPQARMGYVGQHLVSVVTGFEGGRSGARGHDLVIPGGRYAEIKTCYRVDQLGKCLNCNGAVASVELACPWCDSDNIKRNDDSKWLLTPRSEEELQLAWGADHFYLVLFDFEDLADPRRINARIWRVDPRARGFAYMLVDYYFNIRANSASSAPFNLWPFSLKFDMLAGDLIYHAVIDEDDQITTRLFLGRDEPEPIRLEPLTTYSSGRNLTLDKIRLFAKLAGATAPMTNKRAALESLESQRRAGDLDESILVEALAEAMYFEDIRDHVEHLPAGLREEEALAAETDHGATL